MENNNVNKKINMLTALVVVLAGFVIILGGAFAYMYFNDDTINGDGKPVIDNNENTQINDVVSLDVSSSVVKESINNIIPWWYTHTFNYFYHKNDRLLASDISNEIKMELVFKKLITYYKNNPSDDVEITNDGYNVIVSEDKVIEMYKKLFGNDKYEFTKYNGICPGAHKLEDGRIEIGSACGGTGMPTIFQKIVKAEKTIDELYIYEVVAFSKFLRESNDQGQDLLNLYKDADLKILVSENEGYYDINNNTINLTSIKNQLDTYKYTFKSNGDGTYHFYSIEKQ